MFKNLSIFRAMNFGRICPFMGEALKILYNQTFFLLRPGIFIIQIPLAYFNMFMPDIASNYWSIHTQNSSGISEKRIVTRMII